MSANTGTCDYFAPSPTCDTCNQPIRGGIYRRGLDRLCRACHHQPPSTTPFLGCQVVRFEKAPCVATTPPPPPKPPVPATPPRPTPPIAAPSQLVRSGTPSPRVPRAKPPKLPKPPKPPKRPKPIQTRILAALVDGPLAPTDLARKAGTQRKNIATRIGSLIADGAVCRTRGWYHLPQHTPPTTTIPAREHTGAANAIRLQLVEPLSTRDLADRCGLSVLTVRRSMHNVGAEFDHTAKVWRLKAQDHRRPGDL